MIWRLANGKHAVIQGFLNRGREWVGNSRSTRGIMPYLLVGERPENDPHRPYLIVAVAAQVQVGVARRLSSLYTFAQRPKGRRQAGSNGQVEVAHWPLVHGAFKWRLRAHQLGSITNAACEGWARNNGASLAHVRPAAYRGP